MSNRSRAGLVVATLLVAVVAFLALKPEEASKRADEPAGAQPETTPRNATAPETPPAPEATRIVLRGGAPRGGIARIEAKKGDLVRFTVASDASDEVHLHGYDVTRTATAGNPARFRVRAKVEGVFEIESHTAQDAGREPVVARLVVEP